MALETREPLNLEPGEIYHAAQQTSFRAYVHGSKIKLRSRFVGFVLELEQILKNDRLRVGQGRITCSD